MIKKLIPTRLKDKIKSEIKNEYLIELRNWLEKRKKDIPTFEFQSKHIANTKVLSDREELLKLLPKNGVIAEIGVDKGEFSEKIMDITSPTKLHLIDNWNCERYHEGLKKDVEAKFGKEITSDKIEINFGLSTDVANAFSDDYFDWIYIDTDHTYKTTLSELRLYAAKIKPGGIIAGHDFMPGNITGIVLYGVTQAVKQFCNEENWELVYLSIEDIPSFAIKKITGNDA